MDSWKQPFWLAIFELKQSKKNFLILLGSLILILLNQLPIKKKTIETGAP